MRLLFSLLIICAVAASGTQPIPCAPVVGSQILAADLAAVAPAFEKLAPQTPLAPSPLPGGSRIFRVMELQNLAARNGISEPIREDVCFRLAMEKLDKAVVLDEIRRALALPEAKIEIVDLSSDPVPAGRLKFAVENLSQPSRSDVPVPVLWNGSVVTDENRKVPIWARVLIAAPVRRLVAAEDLRPGTPIHSGQVRIEEVIGFPFSKVASPEAETVIGMLPVRSIRAGDPVRLDGLTRSVDVSRGDSVRVEVRVGTMRIGMTGVAESTGRTGDTVAVRNPASGRTFRARVESRDTVVVEVLLPRRKDP